MALQAPIEQAQRITGYKNKYTKNVTNSVKLKYGENVYKNEKNPESGFMKWWFKKNSI